MASSFILTDYETKKNTLMEFLGTFSDERVMVIRDRIGADIYRGEQLDAFFTSLVDRGKKKIQKKLEDERTYMKELRDMGDECEQRDVEEVLGALRFV